MTAIHNFIFCTSPAVLGPARFYIAKWDDAKDRSDDPGHAIQTAVRVAVSTIQIPANQNKKRNDVYDPCLID